MTIRLEGSSATSRFIADKSHDPCSSSSHPFQVSGNEREAGGRGWYDDISSVETFHDDFLWGLVDGEGKHGQAFRGDIGPFSEGFGSKRGVDRVVVFVGDVREARDIHSYAVHSKCKVVGRRDAQFCDGMDPLIDRQMNHPPGSGLQIGPPLSLRLHNQPVTSYSCK
jgi:hypothetical protein